MHVKFVRICYKNKVESIFNSNKKKFCANSL